MTSDPRPGAPGVAAAAHAALKLEDGREGGLPVERRRDLLAALAHRLVERRQDLVAALDADFGGRSPEETLLAEVLGVVTAARYARHRLRRWAKPRRAGVPLPFWPSRAWIVPQPLGVVGIVAPWNYPLQLALLPLVGAVAAGNRVLLKPSEAVPRTSEALDHLVEASLGPSVARTVLGGPEVAADLVALPLDHLLFTGSATRGRAVMRAAADHLTPLTLELGGKCPAILMPDADLAHAARILVLRKALNAGQTCVAPDTLLVVGQPLTPVCHALAEAYRRYFPDGLPTNLLPAHRHRFERLAQEASAEPLGCEAPTGRASLLVAEPAPASELMRQEIFGPLLPLVALGDLPAAIAWTRSLPAPLAVYLFTRDSTIEQRVLQETRAGALVVNEAVVQAAMDTLPFGGVGASGFGRYHGRAGFDTFSNPRVHLRGARFSLSRLLEPPYDGRKRRLIERLLRTAR